MSNSVESVIVHIVTIEQPVPQEFIDIISQSALWMEAFQYLNLTTIRNLLKIHIQTVTIDDAFEDIELYLGNLVSKLIQYLDLPLVNYIYGFKELPIEEFISQLVTIPINCLLPLVDKILLQTASFSTNRIAAIHEYPSHVNLSVIALLHNEKIIQNGYESKAIDIYKLFHLYWIEDGISTNVLRRIFTKHSKVKPTNGIQSILVKFMPYLFGNDITDYFNTYFESNLNLKAVFSESLYFKQFQIKQNSCVSISDRKTAAVPNGSFSNTMFNQHLNNFHFNLVSKFTDLVSQSDRHAFIAKPLHCEVFKIDVFDLNTSYLLLICLKRTIAHLELMLFINYSTFKNEPEIKNKEKICVDYMFIVETAVYQKIMRCTTHFDEPEKALVAKFICDDFGNKTRNLLNAIVFQTFPNCYIPHIAHFSNHKQINEIAKDLMLQPDSTKKTFAINFLAHCRHPVFKSYLESLLMNENRRMDVEDEIKKLEEIPYYSGLSRLFLNAVYKGYENNAENPLNSAFKRSFEMFKDL